MPEGWKRVPKNHSGECGHGCPCVTRGPRFSVRLGRDRVDTEEHFECRRCLRLTPAEEGSGDDEIDPHGDLCGDCWFHIKRNADREFSTLGERRVPPRNDISCRRAFGWWHWSDVLDFSGTQLLLRDGSTWVRQPLSSKIAWICTRGPR